MKPIIIGLDGVDYAGKSTIAQTIKEHLRQEGLSVELINFPTRDGHGALARQALVNGDNAECAKHMALNMKEVLDNLAALPGPHVIIYDRFTISTCANQGDVAITEASKHDLYNHDYVPDYYYVLTLPYHVALERAQRRADETGIDWDDGVTSQHMESERAWVNLNQRYIQAMKFTQGVMGNTYLTMCRCENDYNIEETIRRIRTDIVGMRSRRIAEATSHESLV